MTRDLTDQKEWVSSNAYDSTCTLYFIFIDFCY